MRKNLKEARPRAGLRQREMAEHLEIDLRTYQRIEAGETPGKEPRTAQSHECQRCYNDIGKEILLL